MIDGNTQNVSRARVYWKSDGDRANVTLWLPVLLVLCDESKICILKYSPETKRRPSARQAAKDYVEYGLANLREWIM